MIKENSEIIQAFPIGPHTFVGTANGFNPKGYNILHAAEDGDITFDFAGGTSITVSAVAGLDLVIHESCVSITSAGTVWIS